MIARRGILGALVGLVAAPAIIRVADLMPVKSSLVLPRPNLYLTLDEVTRESVRLFAHSNAFLQSLQTTSLDIELGIMARLDEALPSAQASPVQVAALGAAAVLGRNPTVSRRFFGGVREGEPVASPGFSSSVHPRRITNQETVA